MTEIAYTLAPAPLGLMWESTPIAQLVRASGFQPEGRRFKSCSAASKRAPLKRECYTSLGARTASQSSTLNDQWSRFIYHDSSLEPRKITVQSLTKSVSMVTSISESDSAVPHTAVTVSFPNTGLA